MSIDPYQRAKDIRAGKLDNEMPDYEELTGWIQRMPLTWVGGLLSAIIHRAVLGPFFRDDTALLLFVKRSIDKTRDPNSVFRSDEP